MGGNLTAILVTGGAGYIGSHTAKALTAAGYLPVLYDDLSAGHREAARGAPLIVGDVLDTNAVRRAIREHAVTGVMHFAALTSVADSVLDPIGYYRSNVTGAISVLEAMAREGVSRFVFSSTAAVYGSPETVPIEEDHPTRPINPYGETKLAVERALPHLERTHGIRSIRLRYFNAAGGDPDGELGESHDPETHLIPLALGAASGGPPLRVFGQDYPTPDGTCVRDYVHVTDLADAHVLAINALEADRPSAVYNLGNGRGHTIQEVIATVTRVTQGRVEWMPATRRPGDPAALVASSSRAMAELGWRPRYADLDTIVRTAWQWQSTRLEGSKRARAVS